jgi:uncharacterized oxidoreductase
MPHYNFKELEDFARRIVSGMGADDDIAKEVAQHLLRANLTGHDSHGIIRLGQYDEQAKAGQLIPSARPTVIADAPAAVLLDAHRGFGQFSTMEATKLAIARARSQGAAVVSVRHSMHIGRLGEYADAMSDAGQVSIMTVGMAGPGVGAVNVPGTGRRFLAANPWTIGIPAAGGDVLVDVSTSAVAEGKVRVARDAKKPLPSGALIDTHGVATNEAEDFYAGGSILPLGGDIAVHKGYGLALASAAVGALSMVGDDDPTMAGASSVSGDDNTGRIAGVTIVAIDLAVFGGEESYRQLIGASTSAIRNFPPRSDVAPVVPGEPERRSKQQRCDEGIELPIATVERLNRVATDHGVEPITLGA